MFNKKFETWFKKIDGSQRTPNALLSSAEQKKDVGKYVFFDFENGWQQRISEDIEMDLT